MRKFVVFALILFADLVTKHLVAIHLPIIQPYLGFPFGGIGILNTSLLKISIVHTTNTGIAWGLFASHQALLLIFRILITAGILGFLIFYKPPKHLQMPLTFIAAGAIGNIVDYFIYGHVIDMVYFIFYKYSYPIFNVADSAIFLAVIYLLFNSKKTKKRSHAKSH